MYAKLANTGLPQWPSTLHHFVSANSSCYNHSAPFQYNAHVTDTIDTGETCLDWSLFDDFDDKWSTDTFPESTAAASANYCRNPDHHKYGPWCYTSLTGGYSYCWVPWCSHAGRLNFHQLADFYLWMFTNNMFHSYGIHHTLLLVHYILPSPKRKYQNELHV